MNRLTIQKKVENEICRNDVLQNFRKIKKAPLISPPGVSVRELQAHSSTWLLTVSLPAKEPQNWSTMESIFPPNRRIDIFPAQKKMVISRTLDPKLWEWFPHIIPDHKSLSFSSKFRLEFPASWDLHHELSVVVLHLAACKRRKCNKKKYR